MNARSATSWKRLRSRLARPTTPPRPEPATPDAPPAPAAAPAAPSVDPRYVSGWAQLRRAVEGTLLVTSPDPTTFDAGTSRELADEARLARAQAQFVDALVAGEGTERAVYRAVDALSAIGRWGDALGLASWVSGLPGQEQVGRIGAVLVAHRRGQLARAWTQVRALPDDLVARHLPLEAVESALAVGTEESQAWAIALAGRGELLDAGVQADLAGRFLATGHEDVARSLAAALRDRGCTGLDERQATSLQLVERWLERRPHAVPVGAVAVAVIDYQSPDQALASGNVGDYVQTLALLGNLARLSGVTFTGDGGLGELVTELQARVRPKLRVEEPTGSVHLLPVNRDFSSAENLPDRTWMVAFGWHMHPVYGLVHDFPYQPGIRPIFASFHVNRLDMLSDDALAYLREHGPVGCRDWATVFLLLSAGVDAFFTGCLTSTIDAVFPRRDRVYQPAADGTGVVGAIDVPAAAAGADAGRATSFTHQGDEYREMSLVEGVRAASDLLADYQRTLERGVTRRLHAYLPLTALGVPVTFRPWHPGDVRFNGLAGLTPGAARLARMQRTIRRLLAQTLADVVGGADDEAVYAGWRERTAPLVEAARERFRAEVHDEPATADVPALVAECRAASRASGPHDAVDPAVVTDVVLAFDQNLAAHAPGTIESIVANASGPVRLWLLGRGLSPAYADWLGTAFPDVPITVVPCDHVDFGEVPRRPERITVSTMDRLLLPELLPDVDRAVYIDVDTVVLGDVCELGRLDLAGSPVAARDATVSAASEWRQAARRLPGPRALELQRRTGLAHGFRGAALNAGVLVMDLARMRRDGFTATYLAWVERYGLHDQDVMLAYLGPGRRVLDPRWNALPALEDLDELGDPQVIHWAELPKPWQDRLTYEPHRWRVYAERVAARVGAPPA